MPLARHYLDLEAGSGVVSDVIHGKDDMLRFLEDVGQVPAGRRRLQYFRDGRDAVRCLEHVLAGCGRSLEEQGRVLEFACGYGRVSRFLKWRLGADRLWVSDVLGEAVEFVRSQWGVPGFVSATEPEQVDLGGPYDLIFVVSLFSHLPEPRFRAWLSRLLDALSPNGLLVFSTHGPELLGAGAMDGAFHYRPHSESPELEGSEYGTTYVHPDWVGQAARAAGAEAHRFLPRGLCSFQDLHVVSNGCLTTGGSWSRPTLLRGCIERLEVEGDLFLLQGWAADEVRGAPLDRVEVLVNGQVVGEAGLGGDRPDVAEVLDCPDASLAGWSLGGPLPGEGVGSWRGSLLALRACRAEDVQVLDVREVVVDAAGRPGLG